MIVLDTHVLLWWALDPDQLSRVAAETLERVRRSGVVEAVPVDTKLWLRSVNLGWEHRDPADRVIVATALEERVPVLTKGEILHGFSGVQCIW